MKANRKVVETACRLCGGTFRLAEDVFSCDACGGYHHAACRDTARCGPALAVPPESPPVETIAPLVEGAAVGGTAEDEHPCPSCGQAIKKQALKCPFCRQIVDVRLARAEVPPNVVNEINEGARRALIFGIVGLFICAPVFGSMAISRGRAALNLMDRYPTLDGPRGKARAGVVLGLVAWGLLVIGLIARSAAT